MRKNFGQTAALSAGFTHARGKIIVAIDADLQNDPADIPKMIDKINGGFGGYEQYIRCYKDISKDKTTYNTDRNSTT